MSSCVDTVDFGAERVPVLSSRVLRTHLSCLRLGIVVLIIGLSGCEALLDVFGGGPAGAGLPADGNGIRVTIKNQSGLSVNLEASFHINEQLTRETLRLLPAEGIEATTQIAWTLTDRVLLTAKVAPDSANPPNAQIQPGAILAEQEFVFGVDFLTGGDIEFIIPSPPPPPAQIIDCNHNGITDATDIANLTSMDCDDSGVPDECELEENDCNQNGIPDECDIASGFSHDCLSGSEPRSQDNIECPPVEVVFVMDTSGSMDDEAAALCEKIAQVETALAESGIDITVHVWGITNTPGGSFSCLTDTVLNMLGSTVPGSPELFPTLGNIEDWGPAVAIVADRFPWQEGAARVIVPLSDEGPHNGYPCNDSYEGDFDAEVIAHAIDIANQNNVFVSPIIGSGSQECVETLAAELAAGTNGSAFQSTTPSADLADSIYQLIVDVCIVISDCLPNGIPDECEY